MWNTQDNNNKPNPEAYLKNYNQWSSGIYPINVTEAQNTKCNQYNIPHYRMGGGSLSISSDHKQHLKTAFNKQGIQVNFFILIKVIY